MSAVLGREGELDEIGRFLDAVEGGGFRLLLLSGQAGIGKTTLWNAGIQLARERGYRVVSSRPSEVETGLAFAALGDLLGPLLETPPADLPAPQREALDAALLRVTASSPPQPLGVSLAVLHVLQSAAAERPVLVAIDDVPWLDEASVRALDFSIRRLDGDRIGFLVARRAAATDEPLPLWLASMPSDRLTRIDVGPLSIDETDALLRARMDLDLPRPLLARLHATSGGTPFYALELGRDLQLRAGRAAHNVLEVPRSLDDLIGAHVAALEPPADEVALHAAALSKPTVAVIVAAIGADRTSEGLRGGQAVGVLEVVDGSIRFAHPLLAAAAYGRATPDRRRQVHDRLAGVVAEAEERARHLARAAVGPDESVARALEEGAAAAVQRGAPDVAAGLAEEAASLTPTDEVDARNRRLLAAAEHLIVAGDMRRGYELFRRVAAELPDGPLRAEALTRRAHVALYLGEPNVAEALLVEAMPMTATDPRRRIAVHSLLAGIGYLTWRGWRKARFDAFEALRLAHDLGDERLELQMLGHAATWMDALGRPWRGLLERADALEVPVADVPTIEHPDLQFAQILTAEGHVDEARRRLERLVESARSSGDWTSLPRLVAVLASIEFEAGALDRAEQLAADAHVGMLQTGEGAFYNRVLLVRLFLPIMHGDVEAARDVGAETGRLMSASALKGFQAEVPLAMARLELSLANPGEARARLMEVMAEPGLGRVMAGRWEGIVALEAEALVALGRMEEARRHLDPVERRARRRGIPAPIGEVARARALLLAAEGEHAEAVQAAEEAVQIHAGLQVPFRTARAWFTFGEVLRRSRQRAASRQAFQSGLELFTHLGARIWIERSQAELGRVAARRPAGSPLTETERQVAELAAAGQTNREIADALFMSVHTVEAHMTRIFRTIGVQSRTELARVDLGGDAGAAERNVRGS